MAATGGRRALVTGAAGQDGVLLVRELRRHGWSVVGTVRPGSSSAAAMAPYLEGVPLVEHELTDTDALAGLVDEVAPDCVVNLAGLSSVADSWDQPELTHEVNAAAVERLLDVVARTRPGTRVVQASSGEVFGPDVVGARRESTPRDPRSPYATSKAAADRAVRDHRDRGLDAASVFLFNHESPIRPRRFVTRRITAAVAEIALGRRDHLELGDLSARRDWADARDHVRAIRLLCEAPRAEDLVLATGRSSGLAELVGLAFEAAGVEQTPDRVRRDEAWSRPADAPETFGDPSRAGEVLGWAPRRTLASTVADMVRADLARLRTGVEEDPAYLEDVPGTVRTD